MLNRMYELAEQSANGTFEDGTDRKQLQKEVTQLRSEIDRIADSANFNGINLLDGSMQDGATITLTVTGTANGATVSSTTNLETTTFKSNDSLTIGGDVYKRQEIILVRTVLVLTAALSVGISLWGGYYLLTGLMSWRRPMDYGLSLIHI